MRVHGVAGEKIAPEIIRVYEEHLPVHGARKVWRQLRREGFRVACCTVLGLRMRRSRPFPAAYSEMYYRQQSLAEGEGFKEPAEVEIGMAGRRGPCGKRARSHRHAHARTPADLDPAQGL
ncbi:MAG: hypothetical protein Kow00122_03710 [Thermoleophilia bacterium]